MEEKSEAIRWINQQLKSHSYKPVTHLEAEIADGITLLKLVQIVADEQLPRHFLRPTLRVQKIENLKICLQFLCDKGIDLDGIKAEDVADGDIHCILLLIQNTREWQQAFREGMAEVETALEAVQSRPTSRGLLEFNIVTKEDVAVLNWVGEMIHRDVSSYSLLSDGRILCNLVNALCPGAIDLGRIMSALPVDRIQMALAAAHHHLDVNPGTLVAKKFAECKDAENLRHYLEKIQMAYQNQVKKREEYQHQRRIESRLEADRSRREAKEKRLQQQQERAIERRRHNLVDNTRLAHSTESLDPVENVAHQFQKEKEKRERTNQARTGQERLQVSYKARLEKERQDVAKQVKEAEMREREKLEREKHERLQRLKEEQEKREQLQKQRLHEDKRKRLKEELKRHEQIRQRRLSEQQIVLARYEQQIKESHKDESERSMSPSDVVRNAAASASGQLPDTDTLLTRALQRRKALSTSGDILLRQSVSLSHFGRRNKHKKGLRRHAISLTDFRSTGMLDTIEEERKSSESSNASEERFFDKTLSEGDIRQSQGLDEYQVSTSADNVRTVQDVATCARQEQLDDSFYSSSMPRPTDQDTKLVQRKSGLLIVKPEHDTNHDKSLHSEVDVITAKSKSIRILDVPRTYVVESAGQVKPVPVLSQVSDKRQEMSSSYDMKLEERVLHLEESNARLKELLVKETKRRVNSRAKRRASRARKLKIEVRLEYMLKVIRLASQKMQDYDACMVDFSRKLAHIQSNVAALSELYSLQGSAEMRFAQDESVRGLHDKIKTLTEKVEYLQRMSFASLNSESLVESAGDREGSATKMRSPSIDFKESSKGFKGSRNFLGGFNPFGKGKSSYHQSHQQINRSETNHSTLSPSSAYSQSSAQLRPPDSSGIRVQRRDSFYKLSNFFGERPPQGIRTFLDGLGYIRYADVFDREHVSMVELQHMNEEHLAQLGIPFGPRLVMVKALQGHQSKNAS